MRFHRLSLTAFGPFPGTEVVDLDRLNVAGLFLLTGPTGAGKTSILDAICFALYGGVPGSRNGAKSFKSDHADGDVSPWVELELTIRDRRFRLHRRPAWPRPSSRARSGFVDERTRASIEELIDDVWHVHSNRVDEVGHLVSTLLGMNMAQFCQVVMLPQGEFQTFLGAGAKERHDVLESLFHTHRFQAIERWLTDHRRSLDTACRDAEVELDQLLARAAEVSAGVAGLVAPIADPVTAPLTDSEPRDFAGVVAAYAARAAQLLTAASSAVDARTSTAEAAKLAQHTLDTARTLHDLQRRHRDAHNRRDELVSAATEVRRREREVLLARRAAAFVPLLELVSDADRVLDEAGLAVAEAAAEVWRPTPGHDLSTYDATAAQTHDLTQQLAHLEAMTGVQNDLDRLQAELATLDVELSSGRTEEADLAAALEALPHQVEAAQQRRGAALSAVDLQAALDHEVRMAEDVRAAAREAAARSAEVVELDAALLVAREQRVAARETAQNVRERRIAGMAAELAGGLLPGAPCPVCGSAEHPRPAARVLGDSDADAEAAALTALDEAERAVGQLDQRRERLVTQQDAAARAAGGQTPEQAEAGCAAVLSRRAQVAMTAADLPAAQAHVADLEASQIDVRRRLDTVRRLVHTCDARRAEKAQASASLRRRLDEVVGAGATVHSRRREVATSLASTERLAAALQQQTAARRARRQATERLDRLVADSIFATVGQVRSAVRSDADLASKEALNRAHAADKAATDKVLTDPTLVRAAASPRPDLEQLSRQTEQASATAGLAATRAARLEEAAERLEALVSDLSRALERWRPLRVRHDVADHVAAMVAGTAKDNVSKTRLSHYVLAARLEQVVAAANLRLRGICAGRYELEHTLARGVGDARGGLGLRVLDSYTGAQRDPATLSGGETFYVSLALALGLADLVNNEIGGAELSTLFVDEGFGSLDAETLDEVLDELDALRTAGRSVGLVSHLAELRIRVPTQLSVVRSRQGSRLDDS